MTAEPGLRERKKQRTRRALAQAALDLFAEKGYDETTIGEIAAAADVSPRTFFSYFPSKEDVLFADTAERVGIARQVLARRKPDDRPVDVLLGAVNEIMTSESALRDLATRYGPVRMRLVLTHPALQARGLRALFDAQRELATALRLAYPDELDEETAAVMVGALVGALVGAVTTALSQGAGPEQVAAAMRRAAHLAARGIGQAGEPAPVVG